MPRNGSSTLFPLPSDFETPRFPLRPAFAIGGHIITLDNHRPVLSGQIGFSPEGFQLASLTFQVDLRTRRPFVRRVPG